MSRLHWDIDPTYRLLEDARTRGHAPGLIALDGAGRPVGWAYYGLANRMLRAHHREAGLPSTFQILDSQDQLAAIKRLLKGLGVDEDRFPPREVMYFINGQKEEGVRARDVARRRTEFECIQKKAETLSGFFRRQPQDFED